VPNPQPATVPNPQPDTVPQPNTVPNPQPYNVPNPQPNTVPNPQPDTVPQPNTVPNPQPNTVPAPEIPVPLPYIVPDNFVSSAVKSICSSMFTVVEDVCPANYQQNLPNYETSCAYDGAALLSYRFDQLKIDASIINDPGSFFTNAEQLAETVFDSSTYYFMVSSVRAGIHDCFIQAQNVSLAEPAFKANAFYKSLPGCSSYCKFPGSSCSSTGDCQLSLTLAQLITLVATGSASTICMNVLFLIVCLLTLSIWN